MATYAVVDSAEVVSADSGDPDLRVAPRRSYINGANYFGDIALNPWPTRRGQDYYGDASRTQILLVPQILVGSNEDLKPFFLGGT